MIIERLSILFSLQLKLYTKNIDVPAIVIFQKNIKRCLIRIKYRTALVKPIGFIFFLEFPTALVIYGIFNLV